MKKLYFLLSLVGSFAFGQALFFDDFETEEAFPINWTTYDYNNDNEIWQIALGSETTQEAGFASDNIAASFGYLFNESPPEPTDVNDGLASRPISIPNDALNYELSFIAGAPLDQVNENNLSVYIVENQYNGENLDNLTPVYTHFYGEKGAKNVSLNLNNYKGKEISVIFRHHDSYGQFALLLDNVYIGEEQLSVAQVNSETKVNLYPNPASTYFKIASPKKIKEVTIFNAEGRLVKVYKTQKEYSVKGFIPGVYYVKYIIEGNQYTQKLILK